MSLRNEFEASGAWLFRHRSYLPLLAAPLVLAAFSTFAYPRRSHELQEIWNVGCLLISCAGLMVRVVTIGYAPAGTSGRNTRKQVADVLSTTGMYSLVRHPLYFGNFLITLGISFFFHTWWMVFIVTCCYALYYERIMFAEEAFLRDRFGEVFEEWSSHTPAIIPRLRGWKIPVLPFSWRTVLRREYTGLFGIIFTFFVLEVAGDSLAERRLRVDLPWVILLALGGLTYLTLRTLKKKSSLLHISGR